MNITEDLPKAVTLLHDLKNRINEVTTHIQGLIRKVKEGDINTAKGVSFLEVKYHMLLSYLMNLSQVILRKSRGESIKGEPAIERLVEIRTVLEKMRPIDQKLKYQIDKLIKIATTGALGASDPLRLKPNPDNLVSKLGEESGTSEEEDVGERDGEKKSGAYRPPKIAAVHYDGDITEKDKQQMKLERAKKRALSSGIMRELREEYHEGPEEIRETVDLHKIKMDKKMAERTEYEESRFVRMNITKKDKAAMRRLGTMSNLDELTRFGDISVLSKEEAADLDDDDMPSSKRRKKTPKKGKGKKKGKRKFH
ncbi:neuroguidin [Lingula anatina]|uniref:Neuroguidin n=1 Tax=Lingula anatina TaxID=7574 RepID=A0A1S3JBK8_LINAN|nr:neuroguidin [Lingula anatina]|eukprot:XP_013407571.1 neuroguidin [Lingula anatina]